MLGDLAIRLRGISKDYKRQAKPTGSVLRFFGAKPVEQPSFCALQPIDLEVGRGESLGIVGRNGSGKSTLLKIIAGVLQPTTGTVEVSGRISALLELGSGFNPEFTGRENVHYNAAMLGLTKTQIQARFSDIVQFSEIGDFLDQPVKTYSSGMTIRLAFAVAINVNPEILIVDEALAVGDVFFQQKCFERVRELRKLGTTLLFVSHDIGAVYKNCSRAILLDHGHVSLDATPREVADLYQAQLILARDERPDTIEIQSVAAPSLEASSPSSVDRIISLPSIELMRFAIRDELGREVETVVSGETIDVVVGLRFVEAALDPHVGFKIRDRFGGVIYETNTYCMKRGVGAVISGQEVEVNFGCSLPIVEGDYTFSVGVADGGYAECLFRHQLLFAHNVASIKVMRDIDGDIWDGVVNLSPSCRIRRATIGPDGVGDAFDETDGVFAFHQRTDLSALGLSLSVESATATAGTRFEFSVFLKNEACRELAKPLNLFLSYHWLDAESLAVVEFDGERTALPSLIPIDASDPLSLLVRAPAREGVFVLRVTFVEEGVRWWDQGLDPTFADAEFTVTAGNLDEATTVYAAV